jgi:uncharacterized protein (TIGR03083 family)
LDEKLIILLESLSPEDWNKQTVAVKWKVKDVVSHLLDGNLRTLSIQRDGYYGEEPVGLHDFQELVNWLNRLNADWVKATKRLSPQLLIFLHKATGSMVSDYYASLDPWEEAAFPVDWAGEIKSLNWMHLAREYSEKWHHQQQIRDATGRQGIMTREFFHPAISTFMLALPFTFQDVDAIEGTTIQVTIIGDGGDNWFLRKTSDEWELSNSGTGEPNTHVTIPADISWKLFSKSFRPSDVRANIRITGDTTLAEQVLEMVSVMA